LAESIAELRQIADGHDDVLAEAAGISAGAWYARPATRPGFELVGKPMDFEALERWTRAGFERGLRFRKGER
jgi:hypothetical protein